MLPFADLGVYRYFIYLKKTVFYSLSNLLAKVLCLLYCLAAKL